MKSKGPCADCACEQQVHPGGAALWNLQYKISAEQTGYCHRGFSPEYCFFFLSMQQAGAARFHQNNSRRGYIKDSKASRSLPRQYGWLVGCRKGHLPGGDLGPMAGSGLSEPAGAGGRMLLAGLNGAFGLLRLPVRGAAATKVGHRSRKISHFLVYNRN